MRRIKEKGEDDGKIKEDTYIRGFDAGFDEGYAEAKREFNVPDL